MMHRGTASLTATALNPAVWLHSGSMLLWSLFPTWVVLFGMYEYPVLSGGMMILLSGVVQTAAAAAWRPGVVRSLRSATGLHALCRKHWWPLAPVVGVSAEDVGIMQALRYADPAVVGTLTRLWPILCAPLVARRHSGRFSVSRTALAGMASGIAGASLVVWSASGGGVSGGWHLAAGCGFAALALAGLALKNTAELSFAAHLSDTLGWGGQEDRKADDTALSIITWGTRNTICGLAMSVVGYAVWGGMPTTAWIGTLLFGCVLAPSGVAMGRAAVMIDGNLGLWAINSAGAVAAVGWAWIVFGAFDVGNGWLLAGGAALITAGSLAAASEGRAHHPNANSRPATKHLLHGSDSPQQEQRDAQPARRVRQATTITTSRHRTTAQASDSCQRRGSVVERRSADGA